MLGMHMLICVRCRDKAASSIQQIDGSRVMVMVAGRLAAMASYTDRKPKLRILRGSI